MGKANFTTERVAGFKCEAGKQQSIFWDAKTPGLGLRATAAGAKAFIFETRLHGKTLRITIGDPRTWTVGKAQTEATRLKALTDQGQDPRQLRADAAAKDKAARDARAIETARKELQARDAWDAYLAHPRPATGKKSWSEQHRQDHIIAANPGGQDSKIGDKKLKPGPLAPLLAMPLHAITAQVVRDWLAAESVERATAAFNSYRKFRAFVRWCAAHSEYQFVVQANCCLDESVKEILPEKKTKQGDCLQREQLAPWFAAVRKIGNPVPRWPVKLPHFWPGQIPPPLSS